MTTERLTTGGQRPYFTHAAWTNVEMNRDWRTALFSCLLLACLCCAAALAQSGRHQPPPQTVAPVPTPTPEPTPKEKPTPVPQLKVLVITDQPTAIAVPSMDVNTVVETVLRRLHESDALSIQTADRMSRAQARKRARNETDRFVVWFSLEVDPLAAGGGVMRPSADDLRIEYDVIPPGRDKPTQTGSVYLRSYSRVPIGGRRDISCYPTPLYEYDLALIYGALETAERIFDGLAVPSPPLCR